MNRNTQDYSYIVFVSKSVVDTVKVCWSCQRCFKRLISTPAAHISARAWQSLRDSSDGDTLVQNAEKIQHNTCFCFAIDVQTTARPATTEPLFTTDIPSTTSTALGEIAHGKSVLDDAHSLQPLLSLTAVQYRTLISYKMFVSIAAQ